MAVLTMHRRQASYCQKILAVNQVNVASEKMKNVEDEDGAERRSPALGVPRINTEMRAKIGSSSSQRCRWHGGAT